MVYPFPSRAAAAASSSLRERLPRPGPRLARTGGNWRWSISALWSDAASGAAAKNDIGVACRLVCATFTSRVIIVIQIDIIVPFS